MPVCVDIRPRASAAEQSSWLRCAGCAAGAAGYALRTHTAGGHEEVGGEERLPRPPNDPTCARRQSPRVNRAIPNASKFQDVMTR